MLRLALLPLLIATSAAAEYGHTEDVVFTARCDGSEQRYVVGLPGAFDPAVEHDLCVVLHGHGSDRWQFVKETRDECRGVRDVALAHQMIFVSPDYRAKTSWMGPKAEADVVQIIGEAKQRYRVKRVFLCGGSMGASSALTFTALHPDLIHGVVCLNGTANHVEYDQFQEAIAESFGGTKTQIPEEYRKRSAEFRPEAFTMPVAITAGGKDTVVPAASSVRLAEHLKALGSPVLLIVREEGGHATDYNDTQKAFEFVLDQAKNETPASTGRH